MSEDLSCGGDHHHSGLRRLPPVSNEALERAARLFRALGDASRLRLLAILAQGEVCVSELAEGEGDQMSTISQRLRVLRNENLLSRRRDGKHVLYALADQHIVDLVFNALAHASELPPQPPDLSQRKELDS